jgi:hypothetical protein
LRLRCVYYKVPRERVASVCALVRKVQQTWVARERGLQAEVLLRVDAGDAGDARDTGAALGPATVMEVWRWEPDAARLPASPPAWGDLETELGQALGEALIGPRHIEDFGVAPG